MPREAEGELRQTADGGHAARITLKGRDRRTFALPTCRTVPEAEARKKLLARLAGKLRRARALDKPEAIALLEELRRARRRFSRAFARWPKS